MSKVWYAPSVQIVNENKLISVFTGPGFTISNLQMSERNKSTINHKDTRPATKLEFDSVKTELYSSVVEAIGDIVASSSSRLLIMAPQADEDKLLKPLLMGRQQVTNIRFVPEEPEKMRIRSFAEK